MAGPAEIAGIGKATRCDLGPKWHRPVSLRFEFHHILPEACGGKSTPGNLVQACPTCHVATHVLLWMLANGGIPKGTGGTRGQYGAAMRGYRAAVAAGTAGRIPNEA